MSVDSEWTLNVHSFRYCESVASHLACRVCNVHICTIKSSLWWFSHSWVYSCYSLPLVKMAVDWELAIVAALQREQNWQAVPCAKRGTCLHMPGALHCPRESQGHLLGFLRCMCLARGEILRTPRLNWEWASDRVVKVAPQAWFRDSFFSSLREVLSVDSFSILSAVALFFLLEGPPNFLWGDTP